MKVTIIGSTGVTGKELVKQMLDVDEISEIISISRKHLNIEHQKIKQIVFPDMQINDLLNAHAVSDHYVCCLGSTIKKAGSKEKFKFVDHDLVVAFGKLAKRQNAKSFHVVSAMGSNPNSLFFYNQVKGCVEQSLIDLDFSSLFIYRPSLLVSNREEFRFLEKISVMTYQAISPLPVGKFKSVMGTKVTDLAKKIVFSLLDRNKTKLKIYKSTEIL